MGLESKRYYPRQLTQQDELLYSKTNLTKIGLVKRTLKNNGLDRLKEKGRYLCHQFA